MSQWITSLSKKSPCYWFPSWKSQNRHHRNNLLSCIFRQLETHWEYSNEELAVKRLITDAGQLGISQWVVSNCTVCHLFFLFFYYYHLPLLLYFTLILSIELLLSQSTSFSLILLLIQPGLERERRGWTGSWVVPNFHMGLKHDILAPLFSDVLLPQF